MEYHEPETYCPGELSGLSWADLQSLAKYYTRVAESLQQRAQRLRGIELMEKQSKDRVDGLEASYKVVLAYLDKGYNSIDSAIAAAARDLHLQEHTVMGWWKIFVKTRDRAAREERNAFILRRIKAGYNNYEIAACLHVHTNTVSRAVGEYLHGSMRPCDRARLRKRRKLSPPPSPAP
jgi:DNA-binding NarL/FixJ family response regulator